MKRTIVGVTMGASAVDVRCAHASMADGRTTVISLREGSSNEDTASVVAGWVRAATDPVLIALDAPLGWPVRLGAVLAGHRAGRMPPDDADALFARGTDRVVSAILGEPLLDLIARRGSAYVALAFLEDVRARAGAEIPLAWTPEFESPSVIEVHPAATLRAHRIASRGYERPAETDHRYNVAIALRDRIRLPRDIGEIVADVGALDAVASVLAAHDFLTGRAARPSDDDAARREGWIWVRDSDDRRAT